MSQRLTIAVVGLGKIGLPLAVQYASKGHTVVGVDINESLVAGVNDGVEPFPGEEGLTGLLGDLVASGLLCATIDYSNVSRAEVVVVVVPLMVDSQGSPDFAWMDDATNKIAQHLTPGSLVIYETTLPVGTTRNRWKPTLESVSGLREGHDFHVAFSPERVMTGRVFADLRKYPKLIGGLSELGTAAVKSFYEAVLDFDDRPDLDRPNGVWDLGTPEAAEMAKLAETTYRDVNIGLANQFALYCEASGIDVYEVIEACNSQPFSHIHQPGISVGGHCIPVYPRLYLANDPLASIVSAAREANLEMPKHAVTRLRNSVGSLRGLRVGVLGVSYRAGVKETAYSGTFPIVAELERLGAIPLVHDPLYTPTELMRLGLSPLSLGEKVDALIVHTAHQLYRDLRSSDFPSVTHVIDGRNVLNPLGFPDVELLRLGRPGAHAHP